ncbi:MAG: S-layer glycoprotein N-glycosyltransferase AglJ [Halobacteria archaeon]
MAVESVRILIPTLNEEATIGPLVEEFVRAGYPVLVADGHSTDRTAERARAAGAEVMLQQGKGKGAAVVQALRAIREPIVLMVDGDGTYLPAEAERLLEPVRKGVADHVVGNRFVHPERGAFTRLNFFGNKVLNKVFGLGYGVWLSDILSGYRALRREAMAGLNLDRSGFEIEAEMTIESVKRGLRLAEVPITYKPRASGVRAKLHPLRDGLRIFWTLTSLAKTYNPAFLLFPLGLGLAGTGTALGLFVLYDYAARGATHVFLTLAAGALFLVGLQILVFSSLANLQVLLHRELMRELKKK